MGRSTKSAVSRALWSALLALVLGLRLVTPTGFMPVFDRGQLSVIPCDGTLHGVAGSMTHGAHHGGKDAHQSCPYAAGAAPALLPVDGFAGLDLVPIAPVTIGAFAALLIERGGHDRPPATGPPFLQLNLSHL